MHTISSNKTRKHDDRLTILSNINNTYNYNDISHPTSLEDAKVFELNNEICINIYTINDNNDVFMYQLGNVKYYKHVLNLLLIYDV